MTSDQQPGDETADPPGPSPHATSLEPTPSDQPFGGLDVAKVQSPLSPFEGLLAPRPVSAAPPETARWLAFAGVLVGGLLGGLIGYGVSDLLTTGTVWSALGGMAGALIGAVGVGIVSALTLRAMGEWRAVHHPEADEPGTQ